MIKSAKISLLIVPLFFIWACAEKNKKEKDPFQEKIDATTSTVDHATGFGLEQGSDFTVLTVKTPWPGSEKEFRYALVPKEKLAVLTLPRDAYDAIIATPVEELVVTSTTHIPALESLGALHKLIGFPDTKYISSPPARKLISEGKIKELGSNESINTEMVINLQPDAVIGFTIDNQNSVYNTIEQARIPVLYNGDWTEQHPLGKAEWIKFFGAILGKEKKADSLFAEIEESYLNIKALASKAKKTPTVVSGALYKDVWYLPAGDSWASQFLQDANANYLWGDSEGTGSLSLSLESVIEKGAEAEFWVSPSQFTSYADMEASNAHYTNFKAFKNQRIFTFANTKGITGGLLYYELAPHRPDLVLIDLVHIFHEGLLPNHKPYFFTPLQ